MNKSAQAVSRAFVRGESKTVGNGSTNGDRLFLFGNTIAFKEDHRVFVTLAGWNTPTTRRWVNSVLSEVHSPLRIFCKDFEPYMEAAGLEPVMIDSDEVLLAN